MSLFLLLLIIPTPVFAANTAIQPELQQQIEAVESENQNIGKLVGQGTTPALIADLVLRILGAPSTGAVTVSKDSPYAHGLTDTLGDYIAYMYSTPPASTEVFIADLLDSANIVEPAYAQGLGFASLTPILGAWKIFRNVSYFFFIIAFLAIGFMIMFRQKIGGQTVVTAQQALPRIIISLLAVTFSFAIAGFLIDIM